VIKDDVLVGGCLYGDTLDGSWYFQQICGGADISGVRDHLMFGKASIDAAGIRAAGLSTSEGAARA
jgi:nitrite reductase (NADH) large subunit